MSTYGRRFYGSGFYGSPAPLARFSIAGVVGINLGMTATTTVSVKLSGSTSIRVSTDAGLELEQKIAGEASVSISMLGTAQTSFFRWVDARIFSAVQDPAKNGLVQGGASRDAYNVRLERVGL